MRRLTFFSLVFILSALLTACGSGAVVFAPTPLPPDLSPVTVLHPSGVFALNVPPDWSQYVQDDGGPVVSMSFSPPGYNAPVLTAAVIHLTDEHPDLALLASDYQALHRPDQLRYVETARSPQADGAWRFSGVRTLSDGTQIPLNTFIQSQGAYISVVEAALTGQPELDAALQIAVNSLNINTAADLTTADISALSFVHTASLEIQNAAAWSNRTGVLFVTGEIANHTGQPIANMPVRVALTDENGTVLVEASDIAMGYQISPRGFAPFSLRFGQGQPVDAVGFKVTMGDHPAEAPLQTVITTPDLTWTDSSEFTIEGHLLVTGTVTNNSGRTVYDPLTMVTVFDGSGDVIGAWYQPFTITEIGAGDTVNYEVRVLEIGGGAINYIVDIQAKLR